MILRRINIIMFSLIFVSLSHSTSDTLRSNNRDINKITPIEVGISSIEKKDENIIMNIYAFNQYPIAGVQLEFAQGDLFLIDSLNGGRCEQNDFTMYSNEKGRILAFSMKGILIPESLNKIKEENILFKIYGKVKKQNIESKEIITLQSIIAGKKGEKLESTTIPYEWVSNK